MSKRDEITKWFLKNFQTHTDWTGTRVETQDTYDSVMEIVDRFINETGIFNE